MTKIEKLQTLVEKIGQGIATEQENREYLNFLYSEKGITEKQVLEYQKGINKELVLKGALVVGSALLGLWLLKEILENN